MPRNPTPKPAKARTPKRVRRPKDLVIWKCTEKNGVRFVETTTTFRVEDHDPRIVRSVGAWLLRAAAWMEARNAK